MLFIVTLIIMWMMWWLWLFTSSDMYFGAQALLERLKISISVFCYAMRTLNTSRIVWIFFLISVQFSALKVIAFSRFFILNLSVFLYFLWICSCNLCHLHFSPSVSHLHRMFFSFLWDSECNHTECKPHRSSIISQQGQEQVRHKGLWQWIDGTSV